VDRSAVVAGKSPLILPGVPDDADGGVVALLSMVRLGLG
jgi:hypothetical protein